MAKATNIFSVSIVILLTILVYLPSLNGDFYHDDLQNLVLNKNVQINELDLDTFRTAAFSSDAGHFKRPISMATFALNYFYFGANPYSFKVVNLILHLLIGILILVLTNSLITTLNSTYKKPTTAFDAWMPLLVATIWLIHPLNVSTVAYIVQRMAILTTLFSILSIVFYLAGRIRIENNNKYGLWFILASLLCIVPAVLSKENGILIIGLIAITELIVFREHKNLNLISKGIKYTLYSGLIIFFAAIVIYFQEISNYVLGGYKFREFTLEERVLTQFRVLIYYIKWLISPNIMELGLYHDDIPLSSSIFDPISTIFSIAAIILLIFVGVLTRKKHPLILLGISWYLVSHSLESSVIALEMIYEHRNYLPSIGIILVIVECMRIFANSINKQKLVLLFSVFVVGILSFTTYIRSSQWSNVVDFTYYEAAHHPNSPRAVYALGRTYANLTILGETRFKEQAYSNLKRASELDDKQILPEVAMMILANAIGEKADPYWLASMLQKLESHKLSASDIVALDKILSCSANSSFLSIDDANNVIHTALSDPHNSLQGSRRSKLLTIYANHLTNRIKDYQLAESILLEAIQNAPNTLEYRINYIRLLIHINRIEDATKQLEMLESIDTMKAKNNIIAVLKKKIQTQIEASNT